MSSTGAQKIEVTLGSTDSSQPVTAQVVGKDPSTDVALLKVDAPSDQLHPLSLGDSSQVQVGDPVVAIGNPFGLDRTATAGIVSALQREIKAPNGFTINNVIQTDAAINPGNSGGPLLDARGEVIGINSQIESPNGGGNVGIGFAVPINTVRQVAQQLLANGKVEHAFLGISGTDRDTAARRRPQPRGQPGGAGPERRPERPGGQGRDQGRQRDGLDRRPAGSRRRRRDHRGRRPGDDRDGPTSPMPSAKSSPATRSSSPSFTAARSAP